MRSAVLTIAAFLVLSQPARAQEVPALDEGTRVWVRTADGRELEGSVVSMSPAEVVLRTGTTLQAIPIVTVRRIEIGDSLVNGIRNGAITGGAVLGGIAAFFSYALCEIPDGCFPQDLPPILLLTGMGAGAGIAAGALVDYLIEGRRTVYSSGSPVVMRVAPTLAPRAAGVLLSIDWGR
jgi:hypothetical protein